MSSKMSEILIIYASRYGSTAAVASLVAQELYKGGARAVLKDVRENPRMDGYGVVVLCSGIYAHKFLPEMERFIDERRGELAEARLAVFGVAMRTETVHKNGRSFGGELIIDRYGLSPLVKGMLHGRMDFSVLTEKDREGLERFYMSIGLSEEEKAERRMLRDEISREECAAFAGRVLRLHR